MKKGIILFFAVAAIIALLLFACRQEMAPASNQSTGKPEVAATAAFVPQTEGEYRQEIERLSADGAEADTDTLQEYYEQLLAMDAFTEEDYVALAAIYAAQGDGEKQAEMLTKVHKLYPSREYVEELSMVWDCDSSDSEVANIVAQLTGLLQAEDIQGIARLTASEEWKAALQSELVGVTVRTRYKEDKQTVEIGSDAFATEIMLVSDSQEMLYYSNDEQGIEMIRACLDEAGNYDGAFSAAYYNQEYALQRSYRGTMQENVCVGELQIDYEGEEYTGHFDSQGLTTEEQLASVTEDGCVIYAYSSDGNKYLYEEHNGTDTFRMDAAYMELPESMEMKQ